MKKKKSKKIYLNGKVKNNADNSNPSAGRQNERAEKTTA
jgi:hypothetical protein